MSSSESRINELRTIRRSSSVKEIMSKFSGSSVPETLDAFTTRVRKMTQSERAMHKAMTKIADKLSKSPLGKKNSPVSKPGQAPVMPSEWSYKDMSNILRHWSVAIKREKPEQVFTSMDAKQALAAQQINESTVSTAQWKEWEMAIEEIVINQDTLSLTNSDSDVSLHTANDISSQMDDMLFIPTSPERRPAPLSTLSPTECYASGIATFESDNTDVTSFFPPPPNEITTEENLQNSTISIDEAKVSKSSGSQNTVSTNNGFDTVESNAEGNITAIDSSLLTVIESSVESIQSAQLSSLESAVSSKIIDKQPSHENSIIIESPSEYTTVKPVANNGGGSVNGKRKKKNRLDRSVISDITEMTLAPHCAKKEDAKIDPPKPTLDMCIKPNTIMQSNNQILQSAAPVIPMSNEGKVEKTEPVAAFSKKQLSKEEKEALKRLVTDKIQSTQSIPKTFVSSNILEKTTTETKSFMSRLLLFALLIIVPVVTLCGVAVVLWPELSKDNVISTVRFSNVGIPKTKTSVLIQNDTSISDTQYLLADNESASADSADDNIMSSQQQQETTKESFAPVLLQEHQHSQQQQQQSTAVSIGTSQWRRPFQNLFKGIKEKLDKLIHVFFPWSKKKKSLKV